MNRVFRRGFTIALKESLTYPTSRMICSAVEGYCRGGNERAEFIRREKPVVFSMGKKVYEVKIGMARGGYVLRCKQAKQGAAANN